MAQLFGTQPIPAPTPARSATPRPSDMDDPATLPRRLMEALSADKRKAMNFDLGRGSVNLRHAGNHVAHEQPCALCDLVDLLSELDRTPR